MELRAGWRLAAGLRPRSRCGGASLDMVHSDRPITEMKLGFIHMVATPTAPQRLDQRIMRFRCLTSASPCPFSSRLPSSRHSLPKAARSTRAIHSSSGATAAVEAAASGCCSVAAEATGGCSRRSSGEACTAGAVAAATRARTRGDDALSADAGDARPSSSSSRGAARGISMLFILRRRTVNLR